MALIRFALGAEADVASGPEVQKMLDDSEGRILSRMPSRHRGSRKRLVGSDPVTPAATGTYIVPFGSPSPGFMWWLVEVVATSGDDRTAPAGAVAALYAGQLPRHLAATTIADTPLMGQLIRPAIAIPSVFTFSKEAFPVYAGEDLFLIVYSPTTAIANATGVATVFELPETAVLFNSL